MLISERCDLQMLNCTHCGNQIVPDTKFCNMCGAPIPESGWKSDEEESPAAQVGCLKCGATGQTAGRYCSICGQPTLSWQEYEYLVTKVPQARRIKKRNGVGLLVLVIMLAVVLIFAVSILIATSPYNEGTEFANNVMPVIFFGLLAGFLLIIVLVWGITRSHAFERAGLTYKEYKRLLHKYRHLPMAYR